MLFSHLSVAVRGGQFVVLRVDGILLLLYQDIDILLSLYHLRRHGNAAHVDVCTRLVKCVYCLVGEMTVGDVSFGKLHAGLDRFVGV